MKCSEIQSNLALCEESSVSAHLEACPLCRVQHDEFQAIRNGLQKLRRPEISEELRNSIKRNIRSEISHAQTTRLPFSHEIREWLTTRFMPYSVGVCASVLVGVIFLTMMFSGMLKPINSPDSASTGSRETSIMLASNRNPFDAGRGEITPSEYARMRLGFGDESPSINPQGALIALTKSLIRGEMKDDEVVVVADVFGNGLAQISEVVEPSRNSRAVGELEKAFDSELAYAPFIPTSLENRPESVRVVLKFQSVIVNANLKQRRNPFPKHIRQ